MITKYFQSIKNIKTTIPAIAFQVQEIVFILPVIPFQNSWCLRLVGEYEPVIPFQIQSGYVLKDKNRNVVFPVTAFQIQGVYNRHSYRNDRVEPVAAFQIPGVYNREDVGSESNIPVTTFQIRGVYNQMDAFAKLFEPVTTLQSPLN